MGSSARVTEESKRKSVDHLVNTITAPLKLDARKDIADGIDQIVEAAIRLDAELCKQKAYFAFRYGARRFTPSHMERVDSSEEDPQANYSGIGVKIVLEPALVKYGTSEGRSFDQNTVIAKAQVECSLPVVENFSYSPRPRPKLLVSSASSF